MTDDGNSPTIPDTNAPTHSPMRPSGSQARSPDERYVLKTLLGQGGMGEVWLARDIRIERDIAIKMMRGRADPEAVARFLREARVQGRLEHPSVVPVHDLGGGDTAPYFAMKRLTGTTLLEVIAGHASWPRAKLLARFVDICLAIEFAHQREVIHRDLKPANIMLGDFGETYVLDWGLARIAHAEPTAAQVAPIQLRDLESDSGSGSETKAGALLGTPGYMAPEQMRGEVVDARTDVFALGCILYEILTGKPAIPRDQPFEATLAASHYRPSAGAPDREVPPELDEACARATAADRANRIGSARELADLVQRFLDGDRDLEHRRVLAAEHAAAARVAYVRNDEQARVDAMRESGRAIALDPTNRDAQELLGWLLLRKPDQIPEAAQRRIDADRQIAGQSVLRLGARAYLLNLLVIVVVKALGVRGVWPFVTVGMLVLFQAGMCMVLARRPQRLGAAAVATLVTGHVALLALVGTFFGSLLFVPIFAFGSLPIMLMMPTVRIPKLAFAAHLLGVLIPVALEWFGVTQSSWHLSDHALVIEPWAVDVAPGTLVIILLLVVVVQMFVALRLFDNQRRLQDLAQEHLHVQTWQLGQLVATNE